MKRITLKWVLGRNPIRAQLYCETPNEISRDGIVVTFARKDSEHTSLNTDYAISLQEVIAGILLAMKIGQRGTTVVDKVTFEDDTITIVNHSFAWSNELMDHTQQMLQVHSTLRFEFIPAATSHSETTMNLQ